MLVSIVLSSRIVIVTEVFDSIVSKLLFLTSIINFTQVEVWGFQPPDKRLFSWTISDYSPSPLKSTDLVVSSTALEKDSPNQTEKELD